MIPTPIPLRLLYALILAGVTLDVPLSSAAEVPPDLPALMRCRAESEAAESRSRMYHWWVQRAPMTTPSPLFVSLLHLVTPQGSPWPG